MPGAPRSWKRLEGPSQEHGFCCVSGLVGRALSEQLQELVQGVQWLIPLALGLLKCAVGCPVWGNTRLGAWEAPCRSKSWPWTHPASQPGSGFKVGVCGRRGTHEGEVYRHCRPLTSVLPGKVTEDNPR